MTHKRQTIRNALVTLLKGKTLAADRVFSSREVPWKRQELPGIAVYALEESPDAPEKRVISMSVLIIEAVTDALDDSLDSLAAEVEAAIDSDPTLGGAAFFTRYTGMKVGLDSDQGRPVGAMQLTYDIEYFT